eukprot:Amastigsp_a511474_69.p3 type:complete len:103 gc:universal Amastigsp_a511474_69:748-440(-)
MEPSPRPPPKSPVIEPNIESMLCIASSMSLCMLSNAESLSRSIARGSASVRGKSASSMCGRERADGAARSAGTRAVCRAEALPRNSGSSSSSSGCVTRGGRE